MGRGESYQELEDKSSSDISVRKYSRDLLPVTWLSKLIWGVFVKEEEDRRLDVWEVSLQQLQYIQIIIYKYVQKYIFISEWETFLFLINGSLILSYNFSVILLCFTLI